MSNEPHQKIVVEVPSTSGGFSPVSSPSPESRIENFRRGWRNAIALPAATCGVIVENDLSLPSALNEYEQFIVDWGQNHQGEVLKARNLRQSSRLFQNMQPDEIRILFVAMADRGLGNLDGDGDRLGWYWE